MKRWVLVLFMLMLTLINGYVLSDSLGSFEVVYNNEYWWVVHSDSTVQIISLQNFSLPLVPLDDEGNVFIFYNKITPVNGPVFLDVSVFIYGENISGAELVLFKNLSKFTVTETIETGKNEHFKLYIPSGEYGIGLRLTYRLTNIDAVKYVEIKSLSLNASPTGGDLMVLGSSNTPVGGYFSVLEEVKSRNREGKLLWKYYKPNSPEVIPLLTLTNYRNPSKRLVCVYSPGNGTKVSIVINASNLVETGGLVWYHIGLYRWSGSNFSPFDPKWDDEFLYKGTYNGSVIAEVPSWKLSREEISLPRGITCFGLWIRKDPLINASISLTVPPKTPVLVTNDSGIHPNPLEEQKKEQERRVNAIIACLVSALSIVTLLSVIRPFDVLVNIQENNILLRLLEYLQKADWKELFIISLILITASACLGYLGYGRLLVMLIWTSLLIVPYFIVFSLGNERWIIIFAVFIAFIVTLGGRFIYFPSVWHFLVFSLFLLSFPALAKAIRIAWDIKKYLNILSGWDAILERLEFVFQAVLSMFVGPGMILAGYAFAASVGLVGSGNDYWVSIFASGFLLGIGTNILLVYEWMLLRRKLFFKKKIIKKSKEKT